VFRKDLIIVEQLRPFVPRSTASICPLGELDLKEKMLTIKKRQTTE